MKINRVAICSAALAVGLLSAIPAEAGVKVGVLTCNVDGGENYFIAISKDMQCEYVPDSGSPERYIGTISDLGVGLGQTGSGAMSWNVIAPAAEITRGVLEGAYGRLASTSPPLTSGPLLGGFEHSVTLQPVYVAGDGRFDRFASGVGGLTLRPVVE